MWHFTVTRIRIAQMRQTQREAFAKYRRRRRELRELITTIRTEKPYTFMVIMGVRAMVFVPLLTHGFLSW